MTTREDSQPLSPAQREIMEIIWDQGECSASEVRDILATRRDVARNTVRTLLERMEAKGWLTHRTVGRTFLYQATRPRNATVGEKVREIVDTFCGGRPEQLVNALLDYRGLNAAELRKIQALLDEARPNVRRKG